MPGPILVFDVAVVLRALVGVLNFERDRRAGRHALARSVGKDAGEDRHRVGFLALGREAGLARLALVEVALDVRLIEAMPGGQPSTMAPIAGPWLSPQVVTRKRWPKVLCDIAWLIV